VLPAAGQTQQKSSSAKEQYIKKDEQPATRKQLFCSEYLLTHAHLQR